MQHFLVVHALLLNRLLPEMEDPLPHNRGRIYSVLLGLWCIFQRLRLHSGMLFAQMQQKTSVSGMTWQMNVAIFLHNEIALDEIWFLIRSKRPAFSGHGLMCINLILGMILDVLKTARPQLNELNWIPYPRQGKARNGSYHLTCQDLKSKPLQRALWVSLYAPLGNN